MPRELALKLNRKHNFFFLINNSESSENKITETINHSSTSPSNCSPSYLPSSGYLEHCPHWGRGGDDEDPQPHRPLLQNTNILQILRTNAIWPVQTGLNISYNNNFGQPFFIAGG